MPSTAYRTTVDITDLGYDAQDITNADVVIADTDDGTFVEVAYGDDVWTLTFDEHGELDDGPTYAPAPWLGPVIKKAAPQLQVT